MIVRKIPWTRQPTAPVGIDSQNPITKGLICVNTPIHGLKNVIRGKNDLAIVGTGPTKLVGAAGIGWDGFTSANYLSWTPPVGLTAGTVLVLTDVFATGTASDPWQIGTGGVGNYDRVPYSDNLIYMAAWSATRYVANASVPGGVDSLLTPNVQIAVGSTTANTHAFYKNNVLVGSVGNKTFEYSSPMRLGSNASGYLNGRIYLVCFWDRIITASERAILTANPWVIFEPQVRNIYVPVAAAGGLSGSLINGSLTKSRLFGVLR